MPARCAATTAASQRYPPQAFYVIFTEGAERMSYYGLTAILTTHMVKNLGFSDAEAAIRFKDVGTKHLSLAWAPLTKI